MTTLRALGITLFIGMFAVFGTLSRCEAVALTTFDFNTELVGQSTSGDPWGSQIAVIAGDFNLFAVGGSGAPDGSLFLLRMTKCRCSGGVIYQTVLLTLALSQKQ